MSREIKFRAWDSQEKRFFYITVGDNSIRYPEDYTAYYSLPGVIRFTYAEGWQQYTGLRDRKGVEIYEGDIVEYLYSINRPNESTNFNHEDITGRGKIFWNQDHARWDVTDRNDIDMEDFCELAEDECEVIGNIHENPNLLEAKDE